MEKRCPFWKNLRSIEAVPFRKNLRSIEAVPGGEQVVLGDAETK